MAPFDQHDYAKMHIAGTLPVSHLPAHASTHNAGGIDALAVDAAVGVGSLRTIGTGALQASAGDHAHVAADRWEVVMSPGLTNPPEPLTNEAGDDWLYVAVPA